MTKLESCPILIILMWEMARKWIGGFPSFISPSIKCCLAAGDPLPTAFPKVWYYEVRPTGRCFVWHIKPSLLPNQQVLGDLE